MSIPSACKRPRTWAALLCALLLCMPLLAHAQTLSGLRVLPHAGSDYTFSGWQSEGAVPAVLTVPLDLGDVVYGATLQLQPITAGETYRVRVQYETSLGLSAEGPHLDLTDWKHCVSEWGRADATDALSFVLPTPSQEQGECFPNYTQEELEAAVRAHAHKWGEPSELARWLEGLRTPLPDVSPVTPSVSPFVAISEVRVKVEVLRKGAWIEITRIVFVLPMGC
jgi:hypothetical protein